MHVYKKVNFDSAAARSFLATLVVSKYLYQLDYLIYWIAKSSFISIVRDSKKICNKYFFISLLPLQAAIY